MTTGVRISGREWLALLAIVLLALGLRLGSGLDDLGVDHFDEGVYALSAHGLAGPADERELWPEQVLFSPPVYFGLAAGLSRGTGMASDRAVLAVSLASGVLTIVAMWWLGRLWFGAVAGVAGAFLLAASEYHIALSRSGLTDTTFALFFLLAVGGCVEAARRGGVGRAVLAGALVGVAWNTKYHGWLAAVIAAAAIGTLLLWRWRSNRDGLWSHVRPYLPMALVPLVAAVCYVPWALFIQATWTDGYAGLAAYQRGLLSGDWFVNAFRNVQFQLFLDGPLSRASIPLAFASASVVVGATCGRIGLRAIAAFGVGAFLLGGSGALLLGAIAATGWLLIREEDRLVPLVLASWIVIWLVLTPFYHPYARLVLPLTLVTCLACGAGVDRLLSRPAVDSTSSRGAVWGWIVGWAAIAALPWLVLPDPSNPWRSTRGAADAVEEMLDVVPEGARVIALGAPTVSYYFHVAGRPAFESVTGNALAAALDTTPGSAYVVFSVYTRQTRADERILESLGDRLELLGRYPFDPKDLRLLDDYSVRDAVAYREARNDDFDLWLYRYDPVSPGDPGVVAR